MRASGVYGYTPHMNSRLRSAMSSRSEILNLSHTSLTRGPSWATTQGTMASSRANR